MIMDFKGVDSMDLPYDTIRRLVVEADDRKYSEYRQILRESGCTDPEVIEDHAKWMYGVDNDNDDTLKNSKIPEGYGFLRNYVTHTQIIHHALTGEGLNVYIENNKSILLVNTSEQGEKAFKAAIDWYKKNGDEKYKIWSESYILQAEDFVQRFNTSINNPYIVRQLEMMTISGLTRPFGAENWDFIKDYIEGLKQK